MQRRSPHPLALRAAAVALGGLLVLSCGGSNNPTSTGIVATFTPVSTTPADGSVTLQAGAASGTTFEVRVSAKGLTDFFGAAFWINYNPLLLSFRGSDDSTSFLRDAGSEVRVLVDAASQTGMVKVGISRVQDQNGTIKGVDVTTARDVIVLTFQARTTTTGSSIVFVDGHGEVTDSAAPPSNQITVTWAGGAVAAL